MAKLSRQTVWTLAGTTPLRFPTFHPQGMVIIGQHTFLSSVEVLENPTPFASPALPGRGVGHLFVIDGAGILIRDIVLGEGAMYHPGGIDFDGTELWVPVGEYRPTSNSMLMSVNPQTFEVRERFRVADSIGWAIADSEAGLVYGGNWGSRLFYTWTMDGQERDRWENPSGFVDYQDCHLISSGCAIASGLAVLPTPDRGEYELGGIATVDFVNHSIVRETPISVFSVAGHVVTRNPFTLTMDDHGVLLHVAPDDGDDKGGTHLLSYRIDA
ncbi:MAG: DUF6454 family protein [Lacisediminihabitans sp.]